MRASGARTHSGRCRSASCEACRLHDRLVDQQAEPSPGSGVRDEGCSLDIRFAPEARCEFRLRIDIPTAPYRRKSGAGTTSPMCDFTAGGVLAGQLRVLLIELKKGAADRNAVKQLQEGLNLIWNNRDESSANLQPHAYLVANRQNAQLKHLLRSSKKYLHYGTSNVQIQVHKCGSSVEV